MFAHDINAAIGWNSCGRTAGVTRIFIFVSSQHTAGASSWNSSSFKKCIHWLNNITSDDISQRTMLSNLLLNIPASILAFFNDYEVEWLSLACER